MTKDLAIESRDPTLAYDVLLHVADQPTAQLRLGLLASIDDPLSDMLARFHASAPGERTFFYVSQPGHKHGTPELRNIGAARIHMAEILTANNLGLYGTQPLAFGVNGLVAHSIVRLANQPK